MDSNVQLPVFCLIPYTVVLAISPHHDYRYGTVGEENPNKGRGTVVCPGMNPFTLFFFFFFGRWVSRQQNNGPVTIHCLSPFLGSFAKEDLSAHG